MTGRRLRLGVVGLGFGKAVHVPAFQTLPSCEVVFNRARDWKEHLREVDAVSVATSPDAHAEIVRAALECGKHVFCEKPITTDLEQAKLLARLASRAGLANMIDFEFPELPAWQEARKRIESGALGSLRYVALHWNMEIFAIRNRLTDSWKLETPRGGGALNAFGSHAFYNLEWLFEKVGGPIAEVSATLWPERDDKLVSASMTLSDGTPVLLSISTHAYMGSGHRIEVYGDDGTLVLANSSSDHIRGFQLLTATRKDKELKPIALSSIEGDLAGTDGRIAAVRQTASRFVSWSLGGQPQKPDFESAVRVQYLIDALRSSTSSGGRVNTRVVSQAKASQ